MPPNERYPSSGFWAFWSSLPGILTGVAAVLAAGATLAALFVGGDDGAPTQRDAGVGSQPVAASVSNDDTCLRRYFEGIASDRIDRVEAGTTDYDVISETQPKQGTIGVTFTNGTRPIGAIRFALFPENRVFKIESIVDARCKPTEDYDNPAGGDKRNVKDSGTLRLRLAGGSYDLTTIMWASAIRIRFVAVTP